jgi:hypothetical protein
MPQAAGIACAVKPTPVQGVTNYRSGPRADDKASATVGQETTFEGE